MLFCVFPICFLCVFCVCFMCIIVFGDQWGDSFQLIRRHVPLPRPLIPLLPQQGLLPPKGLLPPPRGILSPLNGFLLLPYSNFTPSSSSSHPPPGSHFAAFPHKSDDRLAGVVAKAKTLPNHCVIDGDFLSRDTYWPKFDLALIVQGQYVPFERKLP